MQLSNFALPLLIVVAVYFLFLRPQRARQRKAQELTNTIAPGQRVMTTAGMFATVVSLDDEGILLEVSPGVNVKYVRQAVSRVVPAPDEDDTADRDAPDDDTEGHDTEDDDTKGGDTLAGPAGTDPDVYQPALDHAEVYRPATVDGTDDGTKVRLAKNAPAAGVGGATAAGSSAVGDPYTDTGHDAGSGDGSGRDQAGRGSATSALR